jgi:hypothetical protein
MNSRFSTRHNREFHNEQEYPDRNANPKSYPHSEFPDDVLSPLSNGDEQHLTFAVLRLSGNILGLVLGILFSLMIFVGTNWLVFKGGSVVGPHLSLLSHYFIGYSVTFVGSLVGVVYAFLFGYLSGVIIGWIYNGVVAISTRSR